MDRPDFKHDKIARIGGWIVAVLFIAQPLTNFSERFQSWRLPIFCAFMISAILLAIYVIVKSFREGYTKYARNMAIYMAVLLAVVGLLAWCVFTTPGMFDSLF